MSDQVEDEAQPSGGLLPAPLRSLSKLLSKVLRHEPELLGLLLDRQGWTDVEELLRKLNRAGRADAPLRLKRLGTVGLEMLQEVVRTNDKQRFEFSEDGRRIRAVQGHSLNVDLGYPEMRPPAVLYHGTAFESWRAIDQEGLKPMSRQQVHLSSDVETANRVGQRHGRPLVLAIDAEAMHHQGAVFYLAPNGVWLVNEVPRRFIRRQTYPLGG